MSFDEFRSLSEEYPTHRGEYETTAEFSARREAVASRMPRSAWVNVPLDLEYVTYSADAQVFEVQKWAVANRNLNYPAIFQGAGVSFPAAYDNFHLVLPSEVLSRDSYIGENAYGANRDAADVGKHDPVGHSLIARAGHGHPSLVRGIDVVGL